MRTSTRVSAPRALRADRRCLPDPAWAPRGKSQGSLPGLYPPIPLLRIRKLPIPSSSRPANHQSGSANINPGRNYQPLLFGSSNLQPLQRSTRAKGRAGRGARGLPDRNLAVTPGRHLLGHRKLSGIFPADLIGQDLSAPPPIPSSGSFRSPTKPFLRIVPLPPALRINPLRPYPLLRPNKYIAPRQIIRYRLLMQLKLFAGEVRRELGRLEHGGDVRRRRRKLERPVSTRQPMHVTLHSKRAKADWSLLRHDRSVREALRICARRSGVRVYDFANAGSHLHLLVRARKRDAFQAFLRSFAGIVARKVTLARRGRPLQGGRFWSGLAWSRIITWGRDYWTVRHYIFRNRIEGEHGPGIRRAVENGPEPSRSAEFGRIDDFL